jgi:8-oxo-dGTP pyrophosphatase MutT (NUDIX family)
MRAPIIRLGSRLVYQNRWMRVREDAIARPDGSTGIYGVVEKPDFVVIAAVGDGLIHLVEQYRHPIERRSWELPQGSWEQAPDTDPTDLARAELREETGLEAGTLVHAGRLFQGPGYANQGYHVYLATDLTPGPARPEPEEQDMVAAAVPLAEFDAMIRDGRIQDATTVAAAGLLRLKGLL